MYRDWFPKCPNCSHQFRKEGVVRCEGCGGAWLSQAALEERMHAVRIDNSEELSIRYQASSGESKFACPVCQRRLELVQLGKVVLERCPEDHGLWFGYDELRRVLWATTEGEHSAHPPQPEHLSEPLKVYRNVDGTYRQLSDDEIRVLTAKLVPGARFALD